MAEVQAPQERQNAPYLGQPPTLDSEISRSGKGFPPGTGGVRTAVITDLGRGPPRECFAFCPRSPTAESSGAPARTFFDIAGGPP